MSAAPGPTNADLMKRLDAFDQRTEKLAERAERTEKRLAALEADRDLVHRLHARVSEIGEKVTVIHEMLSHSEETVRAALRLAGRTIAADVLAGVRSEMSTVRADVQSLRESVEARPCLVAPSGACPEGMA